MEGRVPGRTGICVSIVANSFQWQGRQQQLDEKFMDFCVSPLDLHDGAKQTGKDNGRRRMISLLLMQPVWGRQRSDHWADGAQRANRSPLRNQRFT